MNVANQLNGLKQSLSTFWSERNKREQNMLLAAVAVVVLALTVLSLRSVRRSSVGRAIIAARDNDDLAASYGMNGGAE